MPAPPRTVCEPRLASRNSRQRPLDHSGVFAGEGALIASGTAAESFHGDLNKFAWAHRALWRHDPRVAEGRPSWILHRNAVRGDRSCLAKLKSPLMSVGNKILGHSRREGPNSALNGVRSRPPGMCSSRIRQAVQSLTVAWVESSDVVEPACGAQRQQHLIVPPANQGQNFGCSCTIV
ncbi:hypothetical protein BR93DRAFT_270561 [Coniochaeta sp. PMI_546]|nr:hypothetical protein BR93DRAFT_270561 [Coniochaeta sp. PMI_546]